MLEVEKIKCKEKSILKRFIINHTTWYNKKNTISKPQKEVYLEIAFRILGMQGYCFQVQLTIHIHTWNNILANEKHYVRKLPFSTWISISTFHLTTVDVKITLWAISGILDQGDLKDIIICDSKHTNWCIVFMVVDLPIHMSPFPYPESKESHNRH